jgi:hypothetical protein
LIGILHWAVKLGHIDIITEVSLLSAHNVMPCEGHLEAVYHIFAYLRKHECLRIVFDEAMIDVDERSFVKADWKDFYGDMKEVIPLNAPELRGNYVQVSAFIDANHAGNLVTHQSQTGILLFVNKALVMWYSK